MLPEIDTQQQAYTTSLHPVTQTSNWLPLDNNHYSYSHYRACSECEHLVMGHLLKELLLFLGGQSKKTEVRSLKNPVLSEQLKQGTFCSGKI